MNETFRTVVSLVARQFVSGQITRDQAGNHVCDYCVLLREELDEAFKYFESEVRRYGGPFKKHTFGVEWGAVVTRAYKYSVRVRLNVEPANREFSVLRSHINTERPLLAGDQLAVRIRQLPRAKRSRGKARS